MVLVLSLLPVGAMATGDGTDTTTNTTDPSPENGGTTTTVTPGTDSGTDTNGTDASGIVGNVPTTTDTLNTVQANAPATLTLGSTSVSAANTEGNTETEIDLSSLTSLTKIYDGSNTLDITSAASSVLSGKNVTLTVTLSSADVGEQTITGVTITGDNAADYKAINYGSLKVNITKAPCKDGVTVTDTVTAYKNVPATYTIPMSTLAGNFKTNDQHLMYITSCAPKESTDTIGSILPEGTGTVSFDDNYALKLELNESFTGFAKESMTFKLTFRNYEDAEVTVKFEARDLSYTVKYDRNGGTGIVPASSSAGSYTAEISLPDGTGLNRTNYEFTGWNTKADGKGTAYNAGAKASKLTKELGGTVTLYAQWKPKLTNEAVKELLKDVEATYKKYGAGADDPNSSLSVRLDQMTGYTWAISGNDAEGYKLTITLSKAAWESKKSEAVTQFAGPGETWDFYPTDANYAQTVKFKYTPTVHPAEEEGGSEIIVYNWVLADDNSTPVIYMNQYFTVTYQMKSTYNALIGMNGKSVQYSVAKGENVPEFKANDEVYTTGVDGFTFLGWVLEGATSGTEPVMEPWKEQKVQGNLTYTGQWKKNSMTIHFNKGADDATGTMADMKVYFDSATNSLTPCAFIRPGYRFSHWSASIGGVDLNFPDKANCKNLPFQSDAEITLVAQWAPTVARVDFALSGYDIGKAANQSKATTQTGHVNFGKTYRTDFWISTKEDGSNVLTTDQFAVDTTYYLFVNFTLEEGYADGGLTKDTVCLNGRAAHSLSKPTGITDDSPNARAGADAITYYTAGFRLPTIRKLTLEVGKNGSVEVTGATNSGVSGVYYAKDGDKVTFKVTPNSGYVCSAFKVDGKAQSSHTLNVSKSHTVKVQFAKESKRDTSNPKTGDGIFLPTTAMLLSAMAICAIAPRKKRR